MVNKKEELKAIRKCIKHWCVNIRRPLLNGDFIIRDYNNLLFWSNTESVKLGISYCQICLLFKVKCSKCTIKRITAIPCVDDRSAFAKFEDDFSLQSCNKLISTLIAIYWTVINNEEE